MEEGERGSQVANSFTHVDVCKEEARVQSEGEEPTQAEGIRCSGNGASEGGGVSSDVSPFARIVQHNVDQDQSSFACS